MPGVFNGGDWRNIQAILYQHGVQFSGCAFYEFDIEKGVALYQPIVKGETVQKLDMSYLRPQ